MYTAEGAQTTKRWRPHPFFLVLDRAVACRGDDDFVFGGRFYGARHPVRNSLPLGARFFSPRRAWLLDGEHLQHERTAFVSRMRLRGYIAIRQPQNER
eukprot:COSAG02_NODE_3845_length_6153_cov_3.206640_5_plen_98_part_00